MSVHKIVSADEYVTSTDLQVKYEHLYKFLMDFLWEFQVVQALANLEIAIFKRFPDKEEMERCLRVLDREISYTYNELSDDDKKEFKESVEDLEEAIEVFDDETAGCELYCVEELVDTPSSINAAEGNESIEDRKFKIGKIKKTTKEERELQEEAAKTLSNPFENNEEGEEE